MTIRDVLSENVKRFLHAYKTMEEILSFGLDDGNIDYNSLFNHKMAVTRALALDRINNPLEQFAMDVAWHIQKIRHPIKMYRLVAELNHQ